MFYNEWQKEVSPLAPLLLIDSIIAVATTSTAVAGAAALTTVAAFDDKTGKIKLSRKALLPKPKGYEEEKPARGPRRDGDRGPRKDGDRGGHGRREGGNGGERRSSGNGEGRRR